MAVSTTTSVKKKNTTKETPDNQYPEWLGKERVKMLVVDPTGHDEPVVGCLNGYNWVVPTGEEVSVPKPIAEIIEQTRRVLKQSAEERKAFEIKE